MAIDPEIQQELLAQEKSEIFFSIADYLQSLIVDTIYEGDYDDLLQTNPQQWTYNKLKTIAGIIEQAEKSADDLIGFIRPTIEDVVEVAYTASAEFASAELLGAGQKVDLGAGWQGLSEYAIDALADGIANKMEKRVNKLAITTSIKNDTTDYIERIVSQVVGGRALSDAQAEAVDELVKRGVSIFKDSKGKMWSIENYVPMYMRTASQQARVQGSLDMYSNASQYLVYISDSPAECPYCRKYEGEVFRTTDDLSEIPPAYKDVRHLNEAKNAKPVGLFHPNCTHQALMFIPDLTDVKQEGKGKNKRFVKDAVNPDDTQMYNNRKKLKNIQKNKRRARSRMKHYKKHGQDAYYKNAKANWEKWVKEEKTLMSFFERQGLGWLGTDERDLLLATMAGVSEKDFKKLKNNPLELIKLSVKNQFPTKLVNPRAREAIAEIIRPLDISTLRVDNIEQLSRKGQLAFKASGLSNIQEFIISDFTYLSQDLQNAVNAHYKKYFESPYGVYEYAKKLDAFHSPPTLPKHINSRTKFLKYVENGGQVSNEYGYWIWEEDAPAPVKFWNEERKATVWDKIVQRKIAEEQAAGALKNKKQFMSGGLPSSGKTRTLSGKDPNPTIKPLDATEYVTLNSDDFKTMLIIEDYATATDKALHEAISDTFIDDDTFGANSIIKFTGDGELIQGSEVWNDLKRDNRDVFDALFGDFQDGVLVGYKENHTFSESFLTEIKETIAERTTIIRTTDVVSEIIGFEAANLVHAESSDLLEYARNKVGEQGYNIIHDVTLGSNKPQKAIQDLIATHGYKATEGLYIIYTPEQARAGIVSRYAEGNFANLNSKIARGRGGRYVSGGVIDMAVQLLDESADETIDLLGRPAIADNEIFLKRLLTAEVDGRKIVNLNKDGFQVIDRTVVDEATGYPKSTKVLLTHGTEIKAVKRAVPLTDDAVADTLKIVEEDVGEQPKEIRKRKLKIKTELPQVKFESTLLQDTISTQELDFTTNKTKDGILTRIQTKIANYRDRAYSKLSKSDMDIYQQNVYGNSVQTKRGTSTRSLSQSLQQQYNDLEWSIENFALNEVVEQYEFTSPVDNKVTIEVRPNKKAKRKVKDIVVKSVDDAVNIINNETYPMKRNHHLYVVPDRKQADILYKLGIAPDLIFIGNSKVIEAQLDFYLKTGDGGEFAGLISNFGSELLPQRYTPLISLGRTVADVDLIPPIINEAELLFLEQGKITETFDNNMNMFERLFNKTIMGGTGGTGRDIIDAYEEAMFAIDAQKPRWLRGDKTPIYSNIDAIAFIKSSLGLSVEDNFFQLVIDGRVDNDRMLIALKQYKQSKNAVGFFTGESRPINKAVVNLKKIVGMNYRSVRNQVDKINKTLVDVLGNNQRIVKDITTTASDDIADIFELTKQSVSAEHYIDAETGKEYLFSIVGKHVPLLDDDGDLTRTLGLKVAIDATANLKNRHVTDFMPLKTKRVKLTVGEFKKQLEYHKLNIIEDEIELKLADKKSTLSSQPINYKNIENVKDYEGILGYTDLGYTANNLPPDTLDVYIDDDSNLVQELKGIADGDLQLKAISNATTKDFMLLEELSDNDLIEVVLIEKENFKNYIFNEDNPLYDEVKDFIEDSFDEMKGGRLNNQFLTTTTRRSTAWNAINQAEHLDQLIYGQGNRANKPITILRGDNLRFKTQISDVLTTSDAGLHTVSSGTLKAKNTIKLQLQSDSHLLFTKRTAGASYLTGRKNYNFVTHQGVDLGTTQYTSTVKGVSGKKVVLQVLSEKDLKVKNIEIDLKDFKKDVDNGLLRTNEVTDLSPTDKSNKKIGVADYNNKTYLMNGRDINEFETIKKIREVISVDEIDDIELGEFLFSLKRETEYAGSTSFVQYRTNLETWFQFSEDVTLREMLELRLNNNSVKTTNIITKAIDNKSSKLSYDQLSLRGSNVDYRYGLTPNIDNASAILKGIEGKVGFETDLAIQKTRDANFLFKDKLINKAVGKGYIKKELEDALNIVDTALANFGGVNNVNLTSDEFLILLEVLTNDAVVETTEMGIENLKIEVPDTLAEKLRIINPRAIQETTNLFGVVNEIVLELSDNAEAKLNTTSTDIVQKMRATGARSKTALLRNANNKIADAIDNFTGVDRDALLEELVLQGVESPDDVVPNKNTLVARYTTSQDIIDVLNKGVQSGELLNIDAETIDNLVDNGFLYIDELQGFDNNALAVKWQNYLLDELGHGSLLDSGSTPVEYLLEDFDTLVALGVVDAKEIDDLKWIIQYGALSNPSQDLPSFSGRNKYGSERLNIIGNLLAKKTQDAELNRLLQSTLIGDTDKLTLIEPLTHQILDGSQQKNTKVIVKVGNEVGSDILDLDNKTFTDKLIISEKGNVLVGADLDKLVNSETQISEYDIKKGAVPTTTATNNLSIILETNSLVGADIDAPSIKSQSAVIEALTPQGSEVQLGAPASATSKNNIAFDFSNAQTSNQSLINYGDKVYVGNLESHSTITEFQLAHAMPVRHISQHGHEYEYIIPSDAQFEVLGNDVSVSNAVSNADSTFKTVDMAVSEKQFVGTVSQPITTSTLIRNEKLKQLRILENHASTNRITDYHYEFDNGVIPNSDISDLYAVIDAEEATGVRVNVRTVENAEDIITEFYFDVVDKDELAYIFANTENAGTLQFAGITEVPSIKSFQVNLGTDASAIQILKALTDDLVLKNIEISGITEADIIVSRLAKIREIAFKIQDFNGELKNEILNHLATEVMRSINGIDATSRQRFITSNQNAGSFIAYLFQGNDNEFKAYTDLLLELGQS